jgi:hypothetical protein
MESSMVKNSSGDSYIDLIKEFFHENFITSSIIKENTHGPFWHISLLINNGIKIIFEGDVGFYVTVEIEGERLELWRYDRSVNNHGKTTIENIKYQLEIIKEFLA